MSKQPPPAPTASAVDPCLTLIQIGIAPPDHPQIYIRVHHFIIYKVLLKILNSGVKVGRQVKVSHSLIAVKVAGVRVPLYLRHSK